MAEVEISLSKSSVYGIAMLVLALAFLYVGVSVTIANPIAFGDEGYHAGMAKKIAETLEIPLYEKSTAVYSAAYFRPPYPHLLYAGEFIAFGFNEFLFKLFIPIFGVLGALVIFLFAKKAYSNNAAIAAGALFLAIPSLITYNVLVYSDSILVFLFACFLYGFEKYRQERTLRMLVFSGAVAGLFAMSKITGMLIYPLIVMLFLLEPEKKKYAKSFALMLVIALAVGASFQLREILAYGGLCQPLIPQTSRCYLGDAPANLIYSEKSFSGYVEQVSTNVSLFGYGVLNFIDFAYGAFAFFLLVAGLAMLFDRKNHTDKNLFWMFFLLGVPLFLMSYKTRVEDMSRYILPLAVPMVVIAGEYFSELCAFFRNKLGKYAAYAAILALIACFIYFTIPPALAKISTMNQVKQFSPSYIEAMKWIKDNTPQDAFFINLWGTPAIYNAERTSVWHMPEQGDIMLSNDDAIVIPLLERNNITYIVVTKFSIRNENLLTVYPSNFVNYLASSKYFEKVYENTDTIIYKVSFKLMA